VATLIFHECGIKNILWSPLWGFSRPILEYPLVSSLRFFLGEDDQSLTKI
jgi:hypothetical protein